MIKKFSFILCCVAGVSILAVEPDTNPLHPQEQVIPAAEIISTSGTLGSTSYSIKNLFHVPSVGQEKNSYNFRLRSIKVQNKSLRLNKAVFMKKFNQDMVNIMDSKGYIFANSKPIYAINVDTINYFYDQRTKSYVFSYVLHVRWAEGKNKFSEKTQIFVREKNTKNKTAAVILNDLSNSSVGIISAFFTHLGYPPLQGSSNHVEPKNTADYQVLEVDKTTKKLTVK